MSVFGDLFQRSMQELLELLGDTVTYNSIETQADTTIQAIFNEQVGFVDDQARAVFTISTLASNGITAPLEGDRITLNGTRWRVVDVRDANDDTAELRCDRPKANVNQ